MKEKMNYKRIFFEGIVSLGLGFVVTIVAISQAVNAYSVAGKDKYVKYRSIVDRVDEYDYKKGRDVELERTIDGRFATAEGDEQFFYGLARAVYYCNVGFFNTASETFYEIGYIAPDEKEYDAMKVRAVLCDRKNEK